MPRRRRRRAPRRRRSRGSGGPARAPARPSARRPGRRGCRRRSARRRPSSSARAAPIGPGVAVGERAHGVEQVGDVAGAGGDGRRRTAAAVQSVCPIDTTTPRVDEGGDDVERRRAARGRASTSGDAGVGRPAVDRRRARAARGGPPDGRPRRIGASIGPSRCRPSGTAPGRRRGARPRRRAPPPHVAGGHVTTVGRNAVTPYRGSTAAELADALRLRRHVDAVGAVDLHVDEPGHDPPAAASTGTSAAADRRRRPRSRPPSITHVAVGTSAVRRHDRCRRRPLGDTASRHRLPVAGGQHRAEAAERDVGGRQHDALGASPMSASIGDAASRSARARARAPAGTRRAGRVIPPPTATTSTSSVMTHSCTVHAVAAMTSPRRAGSSADRPARSRPPRRTRAGRTGTAGRAAASARGRSRRRRRWRRATAGPPSTKPAAMPVPTLT